MRELIFADDSALFDYSAQEIQRIVDAFAFIKIWPQDQHKQDRSDIPTELYNDHGRGH